MHNRQGGARAPSSESKVLPLPAQNLNHDPNQRLHRFYHAYDSYMAHAFPHDELKPLSRTFTDSLGARRRSPQTSLWCCTLH